MRCGPPVEGAVAELIIFENWSASVDIANGTPPESTVTSAEPFWDSGTGRTKSARVTRRPAESPTTSWKFSRSPFPMRVTMRSALAGVRLRLPPIAGTGAPRRRPGAGVVCGSAGACEARDSSMNRLMIWAPALPIPPWLRVGLVE